MSRLAQRDYIDNARINASHLTRLRFAVEHALHEKGFDRKEMDALINAAFNCDIHKLAQALSDEHCPSKRLPRTIVRPNIQAR